MSAFIYKQEKEIKTAAKSFGAMEEDSVKRCKLTGMDRHEIEQHTERISEWREMAEAGYQVICGISMVRNMTRSSSSPPTYCYITINL